MVDQHPPQPETCRPTLAIAQLDQPALALEHLGGQLATVLSGHGPFDALDDRGCRAAVVLELLGTVVDVDPGSSCRCTRSRRSRRNLVLELKTLSTAAGLEKGISYSVEMVESETADAAS